MTAWIGKTGLNPEELQQVRQLAQLVQTHDNIELKLNWDMLMSRKPDETNDFWCIRDGRLIGFMGLYVLQPDEAEISGMVHPDYRRRGIGTALLAAVRKECERRRIPKRILICPRDSETGHAFVGTRGAAYEFSEYVMALTRGSEAGPGRLVTLRDALPADVELLVRLNMAGFDMKEDNARHFVEGVMAANELTLIGQADGQDVGKLCLMFSNEGVFIFGFCVLPEFRGRGIGREMLRQTTARLQSEGHTNIRLEVASDNENALGLYESCGFTRSSANDYYVVH